MGQKFGTCTYTQEVIPLVNVASNSVIGMWEAFNGVADNFGIGYQELVEICRELETELDMSSEQIKQLARAIFQTLDSDQNNLIDALEFLTAVAVASGMWASESAEFVFRCYDFTDRGKITLDEMTLAYRSAVCGLCKMACETVPHDEEIESLTLQAFTSLQKKSAEISSISCEEFVNFTLSNPEVRSWVEYFSLEPDGEIWSSSQHGMPERLYSTVGQPNKQVTTTRQDTGTLDISRHEGGTPNGSENFVARFPDSQLNLYHIYGCTLANTHNFVYYTPQMKIVYPCSGTMVQCDSSQRRQQFFGASTMEVVSMAVTKGGDILAACTRGVRESQVTIWESSAHRRLSTLDLSHCGGFDHMAFSSNPELLLGICSAENSILEMYNWQYTRRLYSCCLLATETTLGCSFGPFNDPTSFLSYGHGSINFWKNCGGLYQQKCGIYTRKHWKQPTLCVAVSENSIITGMDSGHMYVWTGRNCIKSVKGHQGAITCLHRNNICMASSGEDRKIRIWNSALEPGACYDITLFGSSAVLQSVFLSNDNKKIVVGTKANEIFELSASDGASLHSGPLASGHYVGKAVGFDCHPFESEFCTVGQDSILKIWDIRMPGVIIYEESMIGPASCVSYAPNGQLIAIGHGARSRPEVSHTTLIGSRNTDGVIRVIKRNGFSLVHQARDSTKAICAIRFSPDAGLLGVYSNDGYVVFYETQQYACISKVSCHEHPVDCESSVMIDFSHSSEIVRLMLRPGHVIHLEVRTSALLSQESVADAVWATNSVVSTAGHHSQYTCADISSDQTLNIYGDAVGGISLSVAAEKPQFLPQYNYGAQSKSVHHVRFCSGNTRVISVASDMSIFLWEIVATSTAPKRSSEDSAAIVERPASEGILTLQLATEMLRHQNMSVLARDGFSMPVSSVVPPWIKRVISIGNYSCPADDLCNRKNTPLPTINLCFSSIYGHCPDKFPSSIFSSPEGNILYSVGSVILSSSISGSSKQSNLRAHTSHIQCMAVHQGACIAASGAYGEAFVWCLNDLVLLGMLNSVIKERMPLSMEFSITSDLLFILFQDQVLTLAAYRWRNSACVFSTTCSLSTRPHYIRQHPTTDSAVYVYGFPDISLWRFDDCPIQFKRQHLPAAPGSHNFLCLEFLTNERLVVGTCDGHLYQLSGMLNHENALKAHDQAVTSLVFLKQRNVLLTSSLDGKVRAWNEEYTMLTEIDLVSLEISSKAIHAMTICESRGSFAIATSDGTIYQLKGLLERILGSDKCAFSISEIAAGTKDTITTVASISGGEVLICQESGTLIIYNYHRRFAVRRGNVLVRITACAITQRDRSAIIAGGDLQALNESRRGIIAVVNLADFSLTHCIKIPNAEVSSLKICPKFRTVAVACSDAVLRFFAIGEEEQLEHKTTSACGQSLVSHMDFSADGEYIRCNDEAMDLIYLDVTSGVLIPDPKSLVAVEWASSTCPLEYYSFGPLGLELTNQSTESYHSTPSMFSPLARIASLDVIPDEFDSRASCMAIGDENGDIHLYLAPSRSQPSKARKTYRGCSGALLQLMWAKDPSTLVVVYKMAVMFWSVQRPKSRIAQTIGVDWLAETPTSFTNAINHIRGGTRGDQVKNPSSSTILTENVVNQHEVPSLALEYVYNTADVTFAKPVLYNKNGEVIYGGRNLLVFHDLRKNVQRHIYPKEEGSTIITALGMPAGGDVIAVGYFVPTAFLARVAIYDSCSGTNLYTSTNMLNLRLLAISFPADSKTLFCLGQGPQRDPFYRLMLISSQREMSYDYLTIGVGVLSPTLKHTFAYAFSSAVHGHCEQSKPSFTCAVGGENQLWFATADGPDINCEIATFGEKSMPQSPLCATSCELYSDSAKGNALFLLTGMTRGEIYIWEKNEVSKVVSGHTAAINAIASHGGIVITADNEGCIRQWNSEFHAMREYDFRQSSILPHPPYKYNLDCAVLSLFPSHDNRKVMAGTSFSQLIEISLDSGGFFVIPVQGHCLGAIKGVAVADAYPSKFYTVGVDGFLNLWDLGSRRLLRSINTGCPLACVSVSSDGSLLAVGAGSELIPESKPIERWCRDGAVIVFETRQYAVVFEDRRTLQTVLDIKFNTGRTLLVASSLDSVVYIYSIASGNRVAYSTKSPECEHPLVKLDFDALGTTLRGLSSANCLIYLSAIDASMLTSETVRDLHWQTHSAAAGLGVLGMSTREENSPLVTSVDQLLARSDTLPYICTGYTDGRIRVSPYPYDSYSAIYEEAVYRHSSHVTNIKFVENFGNRLLTISSGDRSIIQWVLQKQQKKIA